jgi:hypothetical protein
MRVQVRETGSILVQARKSEVLDVLRRTMEDGALVAPDRLEAAGSTYIVREGPAGTRVIHARNEMAPMTLVARERDELRRAVEADLFRLRGLFEVRSS